MGPYVLPVDLWYIEDPLAAERKKGKLGGKKANESIVVGALSLTLIV